MELFENALQPEQLENASCAFKCTCTGTFSTLGAFFENDVITLVK